MNCRTFASPWGNEDTQTLIDILEKFHVKTTFFVVGDWVEKYPESVKALHNAGHEVMSHSNHHDHYNSLSTQQIIDDVTASNQRISAATGVTPTLIRCPYGEYDDHVIAAIRSMGMEPIQWDVDSLDWKDYDGLGFLAGKTLLDAQEGSFQAVLQAHTDLDVPVMTVCPCSKAISREGAHSQRAIVRMRVRMTGFSWLEEFIEMAEESGSSAVYTLLKREDEKFVTEHAFAAPAFVEDVVRNVAQRLSRHTHVDWFSVEVESMESIHNHNAFARIERSLAASGARKGARP